MSYGAALALCKDATELENFLKLVEAEEEGAVFKEGALDSLKRLLEMSVAIHNQYGNCGVRQELCWYNTDSFIDYYKDG